MNSDIKEILNAEKPWEIEGWLPPPKEIIIEGELSESIVREISRLKDEPEWMLRLRLRAFELFKKLPTPNWLRGIDELNLNELSPYIKPAAEKTTEIEKLPKEILDYYKRLGITEAQAKILAGLAGIVDSETIYHKAKEILTKKGVIFMGMSEAIKRYPNLVKKYFSKVYPIPDHKFSALHYALWSGGSFVYVPPGVRIPQPLESFLLITSELESQYEHTMLIADKGSYINFIEGCTAPIFPKYSFHDGAVEVYIHEDAHVKFTTMQNWSRQIINFNNKRVIVEKNGYLEWLEGAIGSKVSYVYPTAILRGENAKASMLIVSISNGPYIKDSGSKIFHMAPNTASRVVSKSISANGGISIYRGLIYVSKNAKNAKSHVQCDSLLLDEKSVAITIPHNQVYEDTAIVTHEATAGKLGDEQLFYLMSRGLSEGESKSLLILGFVDDVIKQLPFEMANILNKAIQLEFEKVGGVG
ncbi:MAG: Fe-S cluster assembly protein SufB [Candidatus Njordarchaeum guaymaensis]|nr:Fe-S cluster assembly protein SufB [Candidatus Korarchaeota archaeon]